MIFINGSGSAAVYLCCVAQRIDAKQRSIWQPRRDRFRPRPAVAGTMAIHQLAHRRNGDRPQCRPRDIVDFAENLAQGLALGRGVGNPGVLLNGIQVLEPLHHVQQRHSPCIARKLVAAAGATRRSHQSGAPHDMHHFRQMMTGDAVFFADLGDRYLLAFAGGEL